MCPGAGSLPSLNLGRWVASREPALTLDWADGAFAPLGCCPELSGQALPAHGQAVPAGLDPPGQQIGEGAPGLASHKQGGHPLLMTQEKTAKRFPRGWDWSSLLTPAFPAPLPEGWGTQAPGSGRSAGPGWRGWRGWWGWHTAARRTKFPDKNVNSEQEGMAVPWKWGHLRRQELLARASEFGDPLGLGARGPGPCCHEYVPTVFSGPLGVVT